jgi:hypothetical protein
MSTQHSHGSEGLDGPGRITGGRGGPGAAGGTECGGSDDSRALVGVASGSLPTQHHAVARPARGRVEHGDRGVGVTRAHGRGEAAHG